MTYISVLLAFVLLMGAREPPFGPVWSAPDTAWAAVFAFLVLVTASAAIGAVWCYCRLRRAGAGPVRVTDVQYLHHGSILVSRGVLTLGFAALAYLTPWSQTVLRTAAGRVPGLGEWLVLAPFVAGLLLTWLIQYRIDRQLRLIALGAAAWEGKNAGGVWTLPDYLAFNLRHQLLVVAVPMTIVITAYGVTRRYEQRLVDFWKVAWAADALLGLVAAGVFLIAPVLLRYIWPTARLPDGERRQRLEALCGRLGLRYREILVWRSGGMMVNAAVMGLFAPVRYILLSDGLLDALDTRRVEAVFGHEAGHVRHRHIQYFALFALCSMFVITGVMELLAWAIGDWLGPRRWALPVVEGAGLLCGAVLWGVGFGWISRRFERQADVFGAHCVSPAAPEECRLPCGVHAADGGSAPIGACVCASGAAVFASALERVAQLNGIPTDERSWRHSSIGSRMRFLTRLASDPLAAAGFERLVLRIKRVLLVGAAIGAIGSSYYYLGEQFRSARHRDAGVQQPEPATAAKRSNASR